MSGVLTQHATAPIAVLRTLKPRTAANGELRAREYVTGDEVSCLLAATGDGRYGLRDRTMILLAYRHGLRVSELVALEWAQFNLRRAQFHVRRLKGSLDSVHPLRADELRLLGQLRKETGDGALLFANERGLPCSSAGFCRMLQRTADRAGLGHLRVHPHMLRHGAGFALVEQGMQQRAIQQWLGHSNPTHTVRYTALSPEPFKDFWRD